MLYLLNLFLGCSAFYFAREKKTRLLFLLIGCCIWSFVAGGQNGIGTDYYEYLSYFENLWGNERFEPLFKFCCSILFRCGIKGQGLFYFYAFLNIVVITIVGRKMKITHLEIYYFLIIVVSTFFHNQMNMVRQATACVFVFAALVIANRNKYLSALLILTAWGFHRTSIIIAPLILFPRIIDYFTRSPKKLLVVASIICVIPIPPSINQFLIEKSTFLFGSEYSSHYSNSVYGELMNDFVSKIPKLILLPFFFAALKVKEKCCLSNKEKFFFNVGLMSYSFWLILLVTSLTARISYYFLLPTIIPLVYYFSYLWKERRETPFWAGTLFLLSIYCFKIYIGTGEYASSFIYFK